jgi:hypothetical protein
MKNITGRTGRAVANQFIITVDCSMDDIAVAGRYFQSYESIIAFIPKHYKGNTNKVLLDINKWDYSTTTGKYRNQFLGENKRETERKIKSGEYVLTNLN